MAHYHLLLDTHLKFGIRTTSNEAKDDLLKKDNIVFLTTVDGRNLTFSHDEDASLSNIPSDKKYKFISYREYISYIIKKNKGEV